jgi:hypothetical protein
VYDERKHKHYVFVTPIYSTDRIWFADWKLAEQAMISMFNFGIGREEGIFVYTNPYDLYHEEISMEDMQKNLRKAQEKYRAIQEQRRAEWKQQLAERGQQPAEQRIDKGTLVRFAFIASEIDKAIQERKIPETLRRQLALLQRLTNACERRSAMLALERLEWIERLGVKDDPIFDNSVPIDLYKKHVEEFIQKQEKPEAFELRKKINGCRFRYVPVGCCGSGDFFIESRQVNSTVVFILKGILGEYDYWFRSGYVIHSAKVFSEEDFNRAETEMLRKFNSGIGFEEGISVYMRDL